MGERAETGAPLLLVGVAREDRCRCRGLVSGQNVVSLLGRPKNETSTWIGQNVVSLLGRPKHETTFVGERFDPNRDRPECRFVFDRTKNETTFVGEARAGGTDRTENMKTRSGRRLVGGGRDGRTDGRTDSQL